MKLESSAFYLIASLLLLVQCNTNTDQVLFYNLNGYTILDDSLFLFNYLVIENDRVIETGSSDEIPPKYKSLHRNDLKGKTVIPGLIDAHGHVMGLGFNRLQIDLAGTISKKEIARKLTQYAEENPDLIWIRGRGWNQTHWPENAFPNKSDIDAVVSDKPVWLRRVDGHAGWANSKALELAGVTKEMSDPSGGKIIRDLNGNPTGVFIDKAMAFIEQHVPSSTDEEREKALQLALEEMAQMGITSVHDAGIDLTTFQLYRTYAKAGKLTTRIYAMIGGTGQSFDEISKFGLIENMGNHTLTVRSVKLYEDGALGSRGAALIQPYYDDPSHSGLLFYNEEELYAQAKKAAQKGYQVSIHAIGDLANRVSLNVFERIQNDLNLTDARNRVEHAQIVALDDIPRFKTLDVIASMQPTHATSDMNMAEDRVGSERIKGAYAWQKFYDNGVVIASGSDFPVEYSNPFFGLYSAIIRQNHDGMPPNGWFPKERMSRSEALKSFTTDAAYAAFQEEWLGSLTAGMKADFLVLDRDIMQVPAIEIWQTNVLETWMNGKKVYSKN